MKKTTVFLFSRIFTLTAISVILLAACQSGANKSAAKGSDTMAMHQDSTESIFKHLLVDNKKDPSCGMPVSAGIGDTAHYKGKVIGFCSKECKDEFLKNPEANIAKAELK
ncbi:MAG TPA: YHS domain-containing protein [Sediminibacterium sp.]|nr:YHS domain-containing protein [Sediminibacterium sp.]